MKDVLGIFQNDYFAPPSAQAIRSPFWFFTMRNWGEGCPVDITQEGLGGNSRSFSCLCWSTLRLQQFIKHSPLCVPTSLCLQWLLLQGGRSPLGLSEFICLSKFQCRFALWSQFSGVSKNSHCLSVCSAFLCKKGVMISKLLPH